MDVLPCFEHLLEIVNQIIVCAKKCPISNRSETTAIESFMLQTSSTPPDRIVVKMCKAIIKKMQGILSLR